jgi:hypothetical protein
MVLVVTKEEGWSSINECHQPWSLVGLVLLLFVVVVIKPQAKPRLLTLSGKNWFWVVIDLTRVCRLRVTGRRFVPGGKNTLPILYLWLTRLTEHASRLCRARAANSPTKKTCVSYFYSETDNKMRRWALSKLTEGLPSSLIAVAAWWYAMIYYVDSWLRTEAPCTNRWRMFHSFHSFYEQSQFASVRFESNERGCVVMMMACYENKLKTPAEEGGGLQLLRDHPTPLPPNKSFCRLSSH